MHVQNISRNASNITKEANEWDVESLSCYHFNSVHYSIGEFSLVWYITVEPRLTTTSLIRPPRYYDHFFLSRRNAQTFPHKKTPLMRPPR